MLDGQAGGADHGQVRALLGRGTGGSALLLTFAADPREGACALRARRPVRWAALGVLVRPPAVVMLTHEPALRSVAVLPLLAAAAGVAVRSPAGRRALVLLSPVVITEYGLWLTASIVLGETPLAAVAALALSAGLGLAVAFRGCGRAGVRT
ncbi:hypothetical protein [Microbispora sp. NPDC049125]|uniref:hypothetical protein n=1 Tax=Microbispora sp. NPDC049125 TaxID=3154929 RepID=UPI0034670EE4